MNTQTCLAIISKLQYDPLLDFYRVDEQTLLEHLNDVVFVFGDNQMRVGTGGAAKLRHVPNSYGFITKKTPSTEFNAYFHPEDYKAVYDLERKKLKALIAQNPDKLFLISKVGEGLANEFGIWEEVIKPQIVSDFNVFPNVFFLWIKDVTYLQ